MIHFSKLHGIGNHFIIIDIRKNKLENYLSKFHLNSISSLAIKLCDVKTGVGSDGIILLSESSINGVALKMQIINADGSEPEMCGNGIRCLAKYAYDRKIVDYKYFKIETLAGIMEAKVLEHGENISNIEINMGKPLFIDKNINSSVYSEKSHIQIQNRNYYYVSMGNPHAVTFVKDYDFDYLGIGKSVENNQKIFPHKTNVEFIRVLSDNEIEMRVWERGCGETEACGTGACASVVVAMLQKKVDSNNSILVHLKGGTLCIQWKSHGVMMAGPAELVYEGALI